MILYNHKRKTKEQLSQGYQPKQLLNKTHFLQSDYIYSNILVFTFQVVFHKFL
nr:MAG TPA: hypothetical protein [Caudoviricetes sp.]DAV74853.1 MAG TPA: hypothetical protein [Caudoviricetes sp.]